MEKYDLIVVGGGFTGVAASLTAASEGLNVLLIEKGNCFGGAAVTGLVNPFMPYWTGAYADVNASAGVDTGAEAGAEAGASAGAEAGASAGAEAGAEADAGEETGASASASAGSRREKLYLSVGTFRMILNALSEAGALGSNGMTFDEEYLKLLLNRMTARAGVKPLFHTYLIGADAESGAVRSITVANKSGQTAYSADYYIDATGDADLAVMCGFPHRLGRPADGLCQPMTLCFRLANVDMKAFEASRASITPLYKELQAQGKIKNIREDVLIFNTLHDGILHFNSTRIVKKNPVDAFDVTYAEIEAREQAHELHAFLKERIDGFQNSKLIMTAPQIGVRESRMIDGEYVLTGDDLMNCVKFEDSIAAGNYDIDIHNPEGSGTSHYYFPEGEFYTIPYRCLIPKGSKNLLVAGRCVSATHEAQASIRIMPIVCCLGEAAGAAAAVAYKSGVSGADTASDTGKANGADTASDTGKANGADTASDTGKASGAEGKRTATEVSWVDMKAVQALLRANGAFLG